MARIKTNDVAFAIYSSTLNKAGADLDLVLKNTVKFLLKNRLLGKSKEILSKLKEIEDKENKHLEIVVKSSNKLEPGSLHEIKHWAVDHYKVKSVNIEEVIDEYLIGGMKIEIDKEIIDMSIKNQVNQLQEFLLKS